MRTTFTSLILQFLIILAATAQNETELRNDGIVVPRTTIATVSSPVEGQFIYDTNEDKFMFYDGTKWNPVALLHKIEDADLDSRVELKENAVGDEINIYLDGSLRFKFLRDSVGRARMEINNDKNNLAIGKNALMKNTWPTFNTVIGHNALMNSKSGQNNTVLGYNAGFSTETADDNVFIGSHAGYSHLTGGTNVFIGRASGWTHENGSGNVFIGDNAGGFNTGGSRNVFLGYGAGRNESGSHKLYIANNDLPSFDALIYGEFDNKFLQFNADVEVSGLDNTDAILLDNGNVRIRHHFNFLESDRDWMNILLDADNNQNNTIFSIFKNVDDGSGTPNVRFHLDGGDSWINTGGQLGIGNSNPAYTLDVSGSLNLKKGNNSAGVALRVAEDEALWYNDTYFSWGFGGTWNLFADDVKIGGASAPSHVLHINGVGRSDNAEWDTSSDRRAKKNIEKIENASTLIAQFRPVTFNWKEEFYPEKQKKEFGFIAQEVEQVIPEMVNQVREEINGQIIEDFRVLNTSALTPLLVKAVQELNEENQRLRHEFAEENKRLNKKISELRAIVSSLMDTEE